MRHYGGALYPNPADPPYGLLDAHPLPGFHPKLMWTRRGQLLKNLLAVLLARRTRKISKSCISMRRMHGDRL
jgi:hypothetical protein